MTAAEFEIAAIVVGHRHRRDLGDLASLARSIEEVGLLHPVVIDPTGRLIAGGRRLEAFKLLGRSRIPVTIIPLTDIARGEFAENAIRKDFLPSEIEAIRRALAPVVATPQGRPSAEKVATFHDKPAGKTRDKIASFAGVSGRTVEKIAAVVKAAEAEPEKFGKLLAQMDRTGHVDGVYRRLNVLRQAEAIRNEPPGLPQRGPYRVICADPPWAYDMRPHDPTHRGMSPYPQQSLEEICALNVGSIAHPDCILWLWTTNGFMRQSFEVLDMWGFKPKALLTWDKIKIGTGDWLRGQTEHCHLAARGSPTITLTNQGTLLRAPSREHSRKPAEFYDFVERLCPAPRYASLYHRGVTRPKWDGHGDEAIQATEGTPA